ncbi:MAG: hypothetical protein AAFX39_03455 [Pseudomonadota bacterium]
MPFLNEIRGFGVEKIPSQPPNKLTVFGNAPQLKSSAYRQIYRQSGFHAQLGDHRLKLNEAGKFIDFNKLRLEQVFSR